MPVIDDWTYTSPSNSTADAVRFLLGDTNENSPLFTDTEIAWLLTENGDKYTAAAQGCEMIALELAAVEGSTVGDVSIGKSSAAYLQMAANYRKRSALNNARPFAGGISQAQKDATRDDEDQVKPSFTRRLFAGNVSPLADSASVEAGELLN
jgi:hypothetical protein